MRLMHGSMMVLAYGGFAQTVSTTGHALSKPSVSAVK
jgi:hypothetical protein